MKQIHMKTKNACTRFFPAPHPDIAKQHLLYIWPTSIQYSFDSSSILNNCTVYRSLHHLLTLLLYTHMVRVLTYPACPHCPWPAGKHRLRACTGAPSRPPEPSLPPSLYLFLHSLSSSLCVWGAGASRCVCVCVFFGPDRGWRFYTFTFKTQKNSCPSS